MHWLQRYRTGILSGAVGTYAAFGDAGPAIEYEVMAELGLGEPEAVDWEGSRDRFAEFGCAIALAARSCGHIGQEIFLACGDDIGELSESTEAVGSSTMPHKVNPSLSISVVSLSREVCAYLIHQQLWMLNGAMDITTNAQTWHLCSGDCLAMELGECITYHNPTAKPARYVLALTTQPEQARRKP